MAKRDKTPTEAPDHEPKNRTGLYVIGAAAVAIVAGVAYLTVNSGPEPGEPREEVEVSELMEAGPLEDIVMGRADAPNTIIEYASMTCGHCASFYKSVFPALKEKYIDTGKARFILREFPLDSLAAAASMLARCAGKDRFYPVVEGLFETQETWALPGEEGLEKLQLIAKQAGFTQDSYDKCLKDRELFDKVEAMRKKAHEEYGVQSTPSFFVNGKRLGGVGLDSFEAAIEGKGKPDTPPSG